MTTTTHKDFLDSKRAQDAQASNSLAHSEICEKQKARDSLSADVEAFLAGGGCIEVVDPGKVVGSSTINENHKKGLDPSGRPKSGWHENAQKTMAARLEKEGGQ